jgi:hypothetical protein
MNFLVTTADGLKNLIVLTLDIGAISVQTDFQTSGFKNLLTEGDIF